MSDEAYIALLVTALALLVLGLIGLLLDGWSNLRGALLLLSMVADVIMLWREIRRQRSS